MSKQILFNIASRSRARKCENLIRNVNELCDGNDHSFVVKYDLDDPCHSDYAKMLTNYTRILAMSGYSDSKISAINRSIPLYDWDIIVDLSDDFVITRKGFDDIIREHCGPDDCIHFPEPYATKQNANNRNANIIIMACMGREYYNRFGYIFNPEYKSLFCDNEVTDVAKILGRYKYVDEDIFYHAHPNAGYGKADKQTRHTESFWDTDKATYMRRKAKNFDL